jgi:RHS repeat-associated protein
VKNNKKIPRNRRKRLLLEVSALFFSLLLISMTPVFAYLYNLTYDKNGNLIQNEKYFYEYDSFNQLVKVREGSQSGEVIAEYFYDDLGNRIKKMVYLEDKTNVTTYYVDKNFVREVRNGKSSDTVYYYDENSLIAKRDSNGSMFYYHPNHLGSTELITDKNGKVVEESYYEPFGASISGGNERYTFTGQEKDPETSLMYYGARYYNPFIARFIQPDTILQNVYDPQSLNRYAYTRNNPVNYVDPTGHFAILPIIVCILFVVDITLTAYDTYKFIKDPTNTKNQVDIGVDAISYLIGGPIIGKIGKGGAKVGEKIAGKAIFKQAEKEVTKQAEKNAVKSTGKDAIEKIDIDKLWGHETTNPKNLFREGAKTHQTDPIRVIKAGNEYLIEDGVGRTTRAWANGEKYVNAIVDDSAKFKSIDEVRKMVYSSPELRRLRQIFEKGGKFDDARALKLLFS